MIPIDSSRIHVGTSGWTYDDWSGRFYPEEVHGADRLLFYAERFDTVEVNTTFYRLPYEGMIKGWNRRLGSRYFLVVKGPRVVTHLKKLEECSEPLRRFLERVRGLRSLRVILWQLPPSLNKDLPLLDRFLRQLPADEIRHAVEFRHVSWWDEGTPELLSRHQAAFVTVSRSRLPESVIPTSDFLYLRFHGLGKDPSRYHYSREELATWVSKLRLHLKGRTLYAFFNNDRLANAPQNAATFRELLLS